MPFISVTRLRLRSVRFLPAFLLHAFRSQNQVKAAPGFRGGSLLADRALTFWTITAWDDEDGMRRFMSNGAHRAAMPSLLNWCDEASVVHWDQPDDALPSWPEADARMRSVGRPSKVRKPSARHADLSFRSPRLAMGGPILPKFPGTSPRRATQAETRALDRRR